MVYTKDQLVEMLFHFEDVAYGYHMFEMVLGIPVNDFENIMHQAACRLKTDKSSFCQHCGAKMADDDDI